MSTIHRAGGLSGGTTGQLRKALLSCGILSSLLWPVTAEVLAASFYPGYDSFSQTISELTSVGAPTRTALTVEGFLYEALVVAFGIGVWRSAGQKKSAAVNKPLRVTGALLVGYGAVGPLWLPFPMTARQNITGGPSFTDTMHLVLGGADALLYVAILAFGAAALGKGFRVYSILTLAVVLVFGAWTNSFVPAVGAGEPTPWLGVIERIMIGSFLLWVVVLAVKLLRAGEDHSKDSRAGVSPLRPS